jgi:deazaflavin-dependent oxidoreductase (nitroreductase family)
VAGAGWTPEAWPGEPRGGTIALETKGRRSGVPREHVVTWVEVDGSRYVVSMLGERADWVRNARANSGDAWIRHGGRKPVQLQEVPVDQRAPVLRVYLKRTAMSTANHLGLKPNAPIEDFQRIAPDHPVFRIIDV